MVVIPFLLLIVLASAGCGSKESSPTTTNTTTPARVVQTGTLPTVASLTVAQYRARASAICAAANRRLNNHAPHGSVSQKIVEEIEFAGQTAGTVFMALARWVPPPRLVRLNAEVVATTRALVQDFPLLVAAAKKGMTSYFRVYMRMAARGRLLASREAVLWKKLGVPACNA